MDTSETPCSIGTPVEMKCVESTLVLSTQRCDLPSNVRHPLLGSGINRFSRTHHNGGNGSDDSTPRGRIFSFYTQPQEANGGESVIAKCKECGKEIRGRKNVTSNFVTHLKRKHVTSYQGFLHLKESKRVQLQYEEPSTPMATDQRCSILLPTRMTSISPNRRSAITTAIVRMIIKDSQPIHIIEREGFRQLIQVLEPSYPMAALSLQHLCAEVLPHCRQQMETTVLRMLEESDSLCVLCDFWPWRLNQVIMSVSGRYVNKETKLISVMMSCQLMSSAVTKEYVASYLKAIMFKYKLNGKALHVLINGGVDVIDMGSDLPLTRLNCFESTLQLCIKDADSAELQRVLQEVVGSSEDVEWNAALKIIRKTLDDDPEVVSVDRSILQEIVAILSPFEEVMELLGQFKTTPMSLTIPCVIGLKKHLDRMTGNHFSDVICHLKDSLQSRFDAILIDPLFVCSAILDPRFRLSWCQSEAEQDRNKETLIGMLKATFREGPLEPNIPLFQKEHRLLSFLPTTNMRQTKSLDGQVRAYLEDDPWDEMSDPLDYWRLKEDVFPELWHLARRLLAIPASMSLTGHSRILGDDPCLSDDQKASPQLIETLLILKENAAMLDAQTT